MTWFPLHVHDRYSLLDSISNPEGLAKRCIELGISGAAITDHGSISGVPARLSVFNKAGLRTVKGCEIYLCDDVSTNRTPENRQLSHLVVLAKNLAGWKELLRLVSRSNDKDKLYYKPRLSLDELREFTAGGNLIAFSGHPGSDLGNIIFKDPKLAYRASSYEEVREHHIHPDAGKRTLDKIEQYISVFGRENFFLEIQVLDPELMPACQAIAKCLRWASEKTGIPCVATPDTHYVNRDDAVDQRILLCSRLRTTLNQVRRRIEQEEDVELGGFFQTNSYHLPSYEEMLVHHTKEELHQSLVIAGMCDDYSILSKPRVPQFPDVGGMTQEGYLRELCRGGWDQLIDNNHLLPKPIEVYKDRLEHELGVVESTGLLASYFNIVQDVMAFSKKRGRWTGFGRGSSAGCLISYLVGITAVDPLRYDLLFERFYNEGRNTADHTSLPDIDCDFPKTERIHVFKYIQGKYGQDRVGKISTFGTLAGKSAIDEVMSAHEIPFELRKQITKIFPDKARISEELQDMADKGEEPSIIKYTLDFYKDELSDWVTLNSDGSISGEMAPLFEQAIRLEGVKKVRSIHAAGVVISDVPLCDVAPLRWDDEDDAWVADMEYPQLESMGLMKLDILGVAQLDKCEGIRDLCATGMLLA